MALDWLYGPRTPSPLASGGFGVGSSFVVNVTDVEDIVAALRERFAVVVVRTYQARSDGGVGVNSMADGPEVELVGASDVDLRAISIVATKELDRGNRESNANAMIVLGSALPATVSVQKDWLGDGTPDAGDSAEKLAALEQRIAQIITVGGRRRVPTWRRVQLTRTAGWLALLALWLVATASTWPAVHWSLVAAAGLVGFAWAADAKASAWLNQPGRDLTQPFGRVLIDATPRETLRLNRAERRANLKVATVSVVATLVAAGIGAWATWITGQVPGPPPQP